MRRSQTLLLLGALLAPTPGCSLVTDLDAFEQADVDAGVTCSAESNERRDLVLELTEFSPHVDEFLEVRIVSSEGNILKARGILDPLEAVQTTIEMPGAIPEGSHHIDFFADHDDEPGYSPPADGESFVDSDHSWRIDPCTPVTEFEHNTNFDILPDPTPVGSDATIELTGVPTDELRHFELRVIDEASGAAVGLYRNPIVGDADTFTVAIPGIIDEGLTYTVAFFLDQNDNGTYDPPPEDEAWEITGLEGEVNETFAYDPDPDSMTDIGF
ncbi:MAG: hypothetical protein ACODAU_07250 [Myxococcota bacterium]